MTVRTSVPAQVGEFAFAEWHAGVHPGMPFGFLSETAFGFAGTLIKKVSAPREREL
jgi:hypothetical protein